MNVQGKTIWQHAAGDKNRDYVDLCLKWGVILNGPGRFGPWPDCRENMGSSRKTTDLRRFCEEMKEGDLVALRLGTDQIRGVGEIVGGYEWHDEFNDVDGWDIGHVRRVRWISTEFEPFEKYTLKLGDTTQILDNSEVLAWIQGLPEGASQPSPRDLPGASQALELGDISTYLFDRGAARDWTANLMDRLRELKRIAEWYDSTGAHVSEHETLCYLVVPLFQALGWTQQKMAIEWNKIDVALFSEVPREDGKLSIVVEVKKIKSASLSAVSQAKKYAETRGRGNCDRIIVTDGLRYGIFVKSPDRLKLHAYMNLTRLRDKAPIHDCGGAPEALLTMTPGWNV